MIDKVVGRRRFLQGAASAAAMPSLHNIAAAQSYPVKPVRWVVGAPPGGPPDIVARLLGEPLKERFGQPFIVDNKPGGGTNIGAEAVVRAAPDGHTLLMCGHANAINATLYKNLNFNFVRDIVPVASVIRQPNALVVNPSFPAGTVPELIAYAKANPGKISMASAGIGTSSHVAGELFKMMAGIDMVHVPYSGGPGALSDLLGGQVDITFNTVPSVIQLVESGSLRALAVTSATRSDVLPQLPTVSDFLPGYEASGWFGVGAPANTPGYIVETLNREVNRAIMTPAFQARLASLGGTIAPMSPIEFGEFIAQDIEKWAKVIRAANITAG